jgi:hypothetical protein
VRVRPRVVLLALLAWVARPGLLAGQAAASDTSARAPDPAEALGIYRPPKPPVEPTDSVAPRGAPSDSAVRSRAAAVVSVPVDSVLALACEGSAAGSEASGILAVAFRAGTPPAARAAAAKAVEGRLAGPTWYGGEEYILVPTTRALTASADGLIRQAPVVRVSPIPCPPPSPRGRGQDGKILPCEAAAAVPRR